MQPLTLSSLSEIHLPTDFLADKDAFIQLLYQKVLQTIENAKNIPGLQSEDFITLKPGIIQRWNQLVQDEILEVTGTDADVRPYFVALQGIIEHVLAHELKNKTIQSFSGVIHTPAPATPLCTKVPVSNSKELVDPCIDTDPLRLFTVKARAEIVRNCLDQGADFFIVYPKEGMNKRTDEQQEIYQQELEKYPVHLHNCPLSCESLDQEQVGAFYLFKNEKKTFAFTIKMTQANSPQDSGNFGLRLGEYKDNSPVKKRIDDILNVISNYYKSNELINLFL